MNGQDASPMTGVSTLAVIALVGVALTASWFEYDFSSGRKTAPESPHTMEDDGVVTEQLTFWATGWSGDVEPSDEAAAARFTAAATWGSLAVAGLALLVALAELPGVRRFVPRRASLVIVVLGALATISVAAVSFIWLPQSMAGHGIDSVFTARLDEPDGYAHSQLGWGWYVTVLTLPCWITAGLLKFQAGSDGLDIIEAHAQAQEEP